MTNIDNRAVFKDRDIVALYTEDIPSIAPGTRGEIIHVCGGDMYHVYIADSDAKVYVYSGELLLIDRPEYTQSVYRWR